MLSVTIGQLKYLKYILKKLWCQHFCALCFVSKWCFNLEGNKKVFHKTSV